MTSHDAEKGAVIDLDSRRPEAPDAAFDTCPTCGSVWWDAAVVFEDGRVTSYAEVRCREEANHV